MRNRIVISLGLALITLAAVALAAQLRRPPAPQGQQSSDSIAAQSPASDQAGATLAPAPSPVPTSTPDMLVPTLIPDLAPLSPLQKSDLATPAPPAQPAGGEAANSEQPAQPAESETLSQVSLRSRLGVGVPREMAPFDAEMARRLGLGWYLDWSVLVEPVAAPGLEFAQMVRVRGQQYFPDRAALAQVLEANPGALWLIGNEPDVPWQDNTTPEDYAAVYHQLYTFIKTLDPAARIAIGGITQVTPLRLLYLERVLASYEAQFGLSMPVDVWNIHVFILREELDSWGVSIPPGFDISQGMLWEIEDHDDLELFRQQVIDFRRWMANRGLRDKPLIVSEYGILMPEGYGFPPERVAEFMTATFDFLLHARDAEIGYPADDNRLVQRLCWYSYSDTVYPTGNLVEPASRRLTFLGQVFADYAARLEAAAPMPAF